MATDPFGANSAEAASVCRCGAPPHPEHGNRCAAGHVVTGNGLALVVGQHSAAFWRSEAEARREQRAAVIAAAGHTEADAPPGLAIAAESLAQAVLIRDAAYLRMVESGGPLASSGRARRSFDVWCKSVDKIEKNLGIVGRTFGLERKAKTVDLARALSGLDHA